MMRKEQKLPQYTQPLTVFSNKTHFVTVNKPSTFYTLFGIECLGGSHVSPFLERKVYYMDHSLDKLTHSARCHFFPVSISHPFKRGAKQICRLKRKRVIRDCRRLIRVTVRVGVRFQVIERSRERHNVRQFSQVLIKIVIFA